MMQFIYEYSAPFLNKLLITFNLYDILDEVKLLHTALSFKGCQYWFYEAMKSRRLKPKRGGYKCQLFQ